MMARFKRLTVEEARGLTRGELLDRIVVEQEYWHRKMDQGRMAGPDREAYKVFSQCLDMLNPGDALDDAVSWLEGRGGGGYFDTRPGDDNPAGQ